MNHTAKRNGWRQTKLKDVCREITVGYVGPMADQYVDDGITFLRSQNIHPFCLNMADVKFISPAFHDRIKKSALNPGDVVVVRTGYPGTACVVPQELPVANCADLVVIRPSTDIDPWFLTYIFNSTWGRGTVAGNLVGVAQQHFNVGAAKEMVVGLPSISVQRKISGILSAYDELIENNTRRIKVLEQMGQALYREWFINFRFPGHAQVKLIASPLGKIPQGWEVKHLKDVANVTYGFPFQSKKFNAAGIGTPVIRIRNILDGSTDTFTDEEAEPKYHIKNGDILVGMDGDFHMCIWSSGHALQNQRVAKFESKGEIGNYHLYLALEQPIQTWNKSIVGTTVAHLGDMHIKAIQFAWPPAKLLAEAGEIFEPMSEQIIALKRKNANLRRTRDLLLPKLISGALDVSKLDIETDVTASSS
ncbi:MAG: restriction endonuclease subunit S [Verrucomicrobiota bacterium]